MPGLKERPRHTGKADIRKVPGNHKAVHSTLAAAEDTQDRQFLAVLVSASVSWVLDGQLRARWEQKPCQLMELACRKSMEGTPDEACNIATELPGEQRGSIAQMALVFLLRSDPRRSATAPRHLSPARAGQNHPRLHFAARRSRSEQARIRAEDEDREPCQDA